MELPPALASSSPARSTTSTSSPLPQVKVCDICGDVGYEEMLAICSECNEGAEHVYCTQTLLDMVPPDWICECCKIKQIAGGGKQRKVQSDPAEHVPEFVPTDTLKSQRKLQSDPAEPVPEFVPTDTLKRQNSVDDRKNRPLQIESSVSNVTGVIKDASSSFANKCVAEGCGGSPVSKKRASESVCLSLQAASCSSPARPEISRENSLKSSEAGKVKFLSPSALPGSSTGGSPNSKRASGQPQLPSGVSSPRQGLGSRASPRRASGQPQLASGVLFPRQGSGKTLSPKRASGQQMLKRNLSLNTETSSNRSSISVNPAPSSRQLPTSNASASPVPLSRTSSAKFGEDVPSFLLPSRPSNFSRSNKEFSDGNAKVTNIASTSNVTKPPTPVGLSKPFLALEQRSGSYSNQLPSKNESKAGIDVTAKGRNGLSVSENNKAGKPKMYGVPSEVAAHSDSIPVVSPNSPKQSFGFNQSCSSQSIQSGLREADGSQKKLEDQDVSGKSFSRDKQDTSPKDKQTCPWSSADFVPSVGGVRCYKCKEIGHSAQDCGRWRTKDAKVTSGSKCIELEGDDSMESKGHNVSTNLCEDTKTIDDIDIKQKLQYGIENETMLKQEACGRAKQPHAEKDFNNYRVEEAFQVEDKDETPQKKELESVGNSKLTSHMEDALKPCSKIGLSSVINLQTNQSDNPHLSASVTTSNQGTRQVSNSNSPSIKETIQERLSPVQSTKRPRLDCDTRNFQESSVRPVRDSVPVLTARPNVVSPIFMGKNGPWPMDNLRINPVMNNQGRPAPWGQHAHQGMVPVGEHAPGLVTPFQTMRNGGIGTPMLLPHNFALPEPPATPESVFLWRGVIEVSVHGNVVGFYDGIQAHPSNRADPKVCQATKALPPRLCAEELRRGVGNDSWPKSFQETPPANNSIGVFLFPANSKSYENFYRHLLDRMMSHDLALRVGLESAQLLIFPSNLLPDADRRWNGQMYLWGVFRGKKAMTSQTVVVGPSHVGEVVANAVSQPSPGLQTSEVMPWKQVEPADSVGEVVDMDIDMEGGRDLTNSHVTTKGDILDSEVCYSSPHSSVPPLPPGSPPVQPTPPLTPLRSQQDASSGCSKPFTSTAPAQSRASLTPSRSQQDASSGSSKSSEQREKHGSSFQDVPSNLQGEQHKLSTIPDDSLNRDNSINEDAVNYKLDLPRGSESFHEDGPLSSPRSPERVSEHVLTSLDKASEVVPLMEVDKNEEPDLPPGFGPKTLKPHPPFSKSSGWGHIEQGTIHSQDDGHLYHSRDLAVRPASGRERSKFELTKSSSLNFRDKRTTSYKLTRSSSLTYSRHMNRDRDHSLHRREYSYDREREVHRSEDRDWRESSSRRVRNSKEKEDRNKREERDWWRRKYEEKEKMEEVNFDHVSKDRYRHWDKDQKHSDKHVLSHSLSSPESDLNSSSVSQSQSCSLWKREEQSDVLSSRGLHSSGKHNDLRHSPCSSNSFATNGQASSGLVESSKMQIATMSKDLGELGVEKASMELEVTDMDTGAFPKLNNTSTPGPERRNIVGLLKEETAFPVLSLSSRGNADASLKPSQSSASGLLTDIVDKNNGMFLSEFKSCGTYSKMEKSSVSSNPLKPFHTSIATTRYNSDNGVEAFVRDLQRISAHDLCESPICLPLFPAGEEIEGLNAVESLDDPAGLGIGRQQGTWHETLPFVQQLERPWHRLRCTSKLGHEASPSRTTPSPPDRFGNVGDSDVGPELTLAIPNYRKEGNSWIKIGNEQALSSEAVDISLSLALGNSVH